MDYSLLHKKLHKKLPPSFDLLVPFYQFEKELVRELSINSIVPLLIHDKMMLVPPLEKRPIWAQDWWPRSSAFPLEHRSEALRILKSKPVLGYYQQTEDSRLAKTLTKDLKVLTRRRIDFKSTFNFNYYSWTTFADTLIICDKPFSRFPGGWHEFAENKSFPPNRAYLKLWELFTVYNIFPKKDDVAIDLGACPGGWSWVLSDFCKKVYSVDRSELSPQILKIPNIKFQSGDAFAVDPKQFPDCNWFFSDIICTPARSYDLIKNWMNNSNIKNFVCTIKFKGECDFEVLNQLLKIENSKIIHLYQNKNEVTWVKIDNV